MPDYRSGLLNLEASAASFFGVDSGIPTLEEMDRELGQGADNVIVVLIDAMGSRILQKHLPENAFLRKYMRREISSVYPPTTAAATTIFDTGKAPVSTGWLGWQMYFPQADDWRVLFLNQSYYSGIPRHDDVIQDAIGYVPVGRAVEEHGHAYAKILPSFAPQGAKTLEEFGERIVQASFRLHHAYIYAYWDALDTLMHKKGTDGAEVKREVERLDRVLEKAAAECSPDTLLCVTADHGMVNAKFEDIRLHADLCNTLVRRPGLEPRCMAFYVKEGARNRFCRLFTQYYGDSFRLYPREEFVERFLGNFPRHPHLADFLGDYVAAAVGGKGLFYGDPGAVRGHHAGCTVDEMMVPLILYGKKERT